MPYPNNQPGYCAVSDVQRLFKNLASFSSLGEVEIAATISDTVAEIDATIAPMYVTPVQGDAPALALLKVINARLAAAEEYRIYLLSGHDAIPEADAWREYAELLLADIKSGDIQFFQAAPNAARPRFPQSAGAQFESLHDLTADPNQAPIFTRIGRSRPRGDVM